MNASSVKGTIISTAEGSVIVNLDDGQHVTIKPTDSSKFTVGQSVWITISDGPFDPTQQPKDVLNTIFGIKE